MIRYSNKPLEEVTLDKLINKKLSMRKLKKKVFKVLTKEELSTLKNIEKQTMIFNQCKKQYKNFSKSLVIFSHN